MDNGAIQSAYAAGVRAYKTHDGVLFYLDTVANYRMSPAESPSFWHALRAYQDEQRKKGVPIRFDQINFRESYRVGITEFYFRDIWPFETGFYPVIQVANTREFEHPKIIGRFTNFRWRAGYPKGGQNG